MLALLQPWDLDQRSSTSLTILVLNWAGFFQPVNELDQTAIHPALSPSLASLFGWWKRQEILAVLTSPRGKPAENSRQNSWPAVEWRQGGGLVWLIFPTTYSFLMISPNLHAIWVFFLLNLSQELKLVLLLYFGTLGDGYSLKGSKK
jgi:hypothetical protein